jgi:two-component system, NtrC family, nitrogen regulation response regulator GlnG
MPLPALEALLLGDSPSTRRVREQAAAAIEADLPVLIEGERGSGRERVARVLHEAGPRRTRRFVRLAPDDTRSEVDRNFERAAGGTLLVKEIARLARPSQRRLLKALRGRGSGDDVRLVGATVYDLSAVAADDRFDADLFRQLGGLKIALAPLRRRPEDIPPLAMCFARDAGEELGRRTQLSPRALDRLRAYPWPGNVAELKDVVGRAVFVAQRATIDIADIERELPRVEDKVPLESLSFEEMVRSKIRGLLDRMEGYPVEDLYDEVIARVERPLIELVLARAGGNQVSAAKMLGLNRNTLRKKIAERGLAPEVPTRRR